MHDTVLLQGEPSGYSVKYENVCLHRSDICIQKMQST